MTATTATETYTTSTVIRAQDFSNDTTDPNRGTWTVGKMDFVIAALAGAPVAITTDKGSGHTLVGARLVGTQLQRRSGGQGVTAEITLSDGTVQRTNYFLPNVGDTIVPLAEAMTARGAKWDALEAHRKAQGAAIGKAQELYGETRQWGSWKATAIDARTMDVTYTPSEGNPHFADVRGERGYWRITLDA